MAVEFTTNLSGAIKDIDKKVRQAAEEIGQAAETHAKLYVTNGVYHSAEGWYRRTGNLRNNITHETQKESNGYSAIVASPTKYALYVELGTGGGGRKWSYKGSDGKWHTTSGMPPRPFIRPAVENHIQEYKEILEEILAE